MEQKKDHSLTQVFDTQKKAAPQNDNALFLGMMGYPYNVQIASGAQKK